VTGALFRLGFLACCCGFVLGLILLARWQTSAVAAGVAAGGVVAAVLLAEDWQPRVSDRTTPGGRARAPRPWRRTRPYGEGDS
jgi:hypothetical protein